MPWLLTASARVLQVIREGQEAVAMQKEAAKAREVKGEMLKNPRGRHPRELSVRGDEKLLDDSSHALRGDQLLGCWDSQSHFHSFLCFLQSLQR